ncbi:hypothetical protein NEOLEDRAFT_1062185 [Neolentinus lepideus HHB14362 ss-1]|uniref:Uncharacterized protein n=1 Tax=Neolentinus lepideus HHB14362 ss-1 TaxID=1314782 RepID=A0A165THF1_9AGAM|nr:hypothetical protein NEOLEDRAFT_1062185 [Neolentinus lepideus HHB14362 ss-1]
MTANISSFPYVLWNWYIEYLVRYEYSSWVGKTASTFRILAFVAIAPFILLTLLDVTSYVIARTLGVVDVTEVSTSDSDKLESMLKDSTPTILLNDESQQTLSEDDTGTENSSYQGHDAHNTLSKHSRDSAGVELPTAYFVTLTDDSMKLSGVGVLSPAASRPSSPTVDLRQKWPVLQQQQRGVGDVSWQNTLGSCGGDPYITPETDSSPEDVGSALRKRTRLDADGSRTTTAGS